MEERVGRREIKGKNSSEITGLFIFRALSLWAFEEVTLMYLCVLGPSAAGGPPAPQGTLLLSAAAAPSMLPLEPFEVGPAGVYSPACKKRVQGAGSAAGGRRDGGPLHPSPACLFGYHGEPFSTYYSTSPEDNGNPIPGCGVGITNTGPPLPEASIALQCQAALGFLNKDEDEGLQLY